MNPRSDTKTIIMAMKYLSEDGIYSEDGVANAAIAEAAQRLEELALENEVILKNQLKTQQDLEWWKGYADKLVAHIPYLPKDMEVLREANLDFANQIQYLEDRLEDAKENLRLTRLNHGLQITDRNSYIRSLLDAKNLLTSSEEALELHNAKLDFLREQAALLEE